MAKQALLTGCDAAVVDVHAEPKGSNPRSRDKACWHLGLSKQVEKGDQKVGFTIDVWGLLGSGLRGIDRNRRASNSLSPVLIHFVAPHGKLLHRLLALEHLLGSIPPLLPSQQHAGPRESHHNIPPEAWPNVVRRVIENHESWHQVAAEYGVSYETVRRLLRASRNQRAG